MIKFLLISIEHPALCFLFQLSHHSNLRILQLLTNKRRQFTAQRIENIFLNRIMEVHDNLIVAQRVGLHQQMILRLIDFALFSIFIPCRLQCLRRVGFAFLYLNGFLFRLRRRRMAISIDELAELGRGKFGLDGNFLFGDRRRDNRR